MKITENVSFNIASEASYVYILSGQKFIKNAKKGFWKTEACGQTELPDKFNMTNIGKDGKNSNETFWLLIKHCVAGTMATWNVYDYGTH